MLATSITANKGNSVSRAGECASGVSGRSVYYFRSELIVLYCSGIEEQPFGHLEVADVVLVSVTFSSCARLLSIIILFSVCAFRLLLIPAFGSACMRLISLENVLICSALRFILCFDFRQRNTIQIIVSVVSGQRSRIAISWSVSMAQV